ncbi:MAG TPA: HD-GYP domain-containing protein [Gaiellaceae bacterium]|nr:HD-GYP domain-containing protein [Gaiellaceae bacterium]
MLRAAAPAGVEVDAGALDQRVAALIAALGTLASAAIVADGGELHAALTGTLGRVATIVLLTLGLQMFSIRVYGRGSVGVSAIGILAGVYLLPLAPAMAIAALAAAAQWLRTRPKLYKGAFDVSNYAVSAGAASLAFHAIGPWPTAGAIVAGLVYVISNNGLLSLAMSLDERVSWRTVWLERFHWARFHFVLFGPLALAATIAYREIGVMGLVAFTLPPALMILSVRQYLERTAAAVDEIRDANTKLRRAHRDTIAALSRSMEAKDVYTGGHTERVAAVAVGLARRLGYEHEELEAIEIGALLHDIGKIGVPESILRKDGPLDEEEWAIIRSHPLISDYILAELDLDPIVRQCARSSHERIDGKGYPDALAGDEIPLPARIVFVADALDALTSDRSYRAGRPLMAALAEIERNAGTQFCPQVVAALRELWRTEPRLLGNGLPQDEDAAPPARLHARPPAA